MYTKTKKTKINIEIEYTLAAKHKRTHGSVSIEGSTIG